MPEPSEELVKRSLTTILHHRLNMPKLPQPVVQPQVPAEPEQEPEGMEKNSKVDLLAKIGDDVDQNSMDDYDVSSHRPAPPAPQSQKMATGGSGGFYDYVADNEDIVEVDISESESAKWVDAPEPIYPKTPRPEPVIVEQSEAEEDSDTSGSEDDMTFPDEPDNPVWQKGTQEEYKAYMIKRYKHEQWENAKILFKMKQDQGNTDACKKILERLRSELG
eukprot:CAMPEP_0168535624 /NCGR_PEP_ID=MMETSP0405-20121227/18867_1 /TAXON_ID=498012 /ORGANISM="Trichosphaerium sp, Strain Am-I-7 wt" /LENGTH=218 /DNA_ID=CAMNT_0008563079 /DNA_START=596 /DNA_END=1249 /DNA_ORIENTATION=-